MAYPTINVTSEWQEAERWSDAAATNQNAEWRLLVRSEESANVSNVYFKIQKSQSNSGYVENYYDKDMEIVGYGANSDGHDAYMTWQYGRNESTGWSDVSGDDSDMYWSNVAHNSDGSLTVSAHITGDRLFASYDIDTYVNLVFPNTTPKAPTLVTVTDGNDDIVYNGEMLLVMASGASGIISGYEYQSAVNGGSWSASKTSTNAWVYEAIPENTNTIKYRVRAKNGSLASAWKESNLLVIESNARSGEVLSGSFQTNKYDSKIGLILSWTATQSVASNKSTISWTLKSTGGSTTAWWNSAPITVKINGTTVLSITDRFKLYGGGAWSKTGKLDIAHNDDGSKSFAASISAAIYTNAVNCTGSATFTLKKIARTPDAPTSCSITAGYGNFVGLGDTLTIKWSGASGVITGYDIQYSRGNSGWKDYKSVSSSSSSGSTTDTFTSTNIDVNGAGKAVKYRVRAKNGSLTSGWKESNTLYIQGGMDIKVSGAWKNGSVWIKVNGEWKRAKRVWIKVNGTWQYDETK